MSILVASLLNTMTDNLSSIIGIDFKSNIIDVFNFVTVLINFESHSIYSFTAIKKFCNRYVLVYKRRFLNASYKNS